jgi:hypothetical protein
MVALQEIGTSPSSQLDRVDGGSAWPTQLDACNGTQGKLHVRYGGSGAQNGARRKAREEWLAL